MVSKSYATILSLYEHPDEQGSRQEVEKKKLWFCRIFEAHTKVDFFKTSRYQQSDPWCIFTVNRQKRKDVLGLVPKIQRQKQSKGSTFWKLQSLN